MQVLLILKISITTWYPLLLLAINKGVDPGETTGGYKLGSKYEYKHSARSRDREKVGKLDIGAYEFTDFFATTSNRVADVVLEEVASNVKFYVYADGYDKSVNVFFNNVQQDKDVYVYNMNRTLVASKKNEKPSKISFAKYLFIPGVYVIRTKVGQKLSIKKFIVR